MKKEQKIKIELDNNQYMDGILYRAGVHSLPQSLVKQFDKADYKVLSKPKKKKKKMTRDITKEDKETVDIETENIMDKAFKSGKD